MRGHVMPGERAFLDWGIGHYERTAQLLRPAAEVLVDAAGVRPGERVLDLGSGTGSAALLAAHRGAVVTAVDPSERLLAVAREAAQEQGLDIACEVGDAAALPAADSTVDCLLSSFGVIFAPDAKAAAAEMARVLVPGGRAVLTAWLPGGTTGALASGAQELVRTAMQAPPAPPGFPWHDTSAVADLFAPHGMAVHSAGRHELVFTAPSPAAYLDAELANHPMAIAAFQLLRERGQAGRGRQELLTILVDRNEDSGAFRSTSEYVVLVAQRSP